jgi:tetratricopeptide (TPR) repeat protein
MAKDTQGDRQTQLDLVDAYTRLGNIQGNLYYQNLGDRSGALVSLDKALALAAPLARAGSSDQQALRALALAQVSHSEVFFGPGNTQEAIAPMQEAVQTYDRLTALPEVTPTELCEAASAYGVLGDGLVQAGASGLADNSAALKAYRKVIALNERALILDPHLIRAKRGLSIAQWKIGKVEMEIDPALALKDFQAGLERIETLTQAEQESLHAVRLRNMLLLDEANALVELGEYSEANTRYTEVLQKFQSISKADPQDMRSLGDLEIVLNRQALGFEYAALAAAGSDRRKNLAAAERLWIQTNAVIDNTVKHHPTDEDWLETQADAQVHLGTIQSILHAAGGGGSMAKSGVAGLKDLTGKTGVSSVFLDMAASDLLMVEPASLRDPKFAVACAERAVALSHRRIPSILLTLAQAYRASGQAEKSRETAKEGLALLPAPQPGSVKPRIRKQLEAQAEIGN